MNTISAICVLWIAVDLEINIAPTRAEQRVSHNNHVSRDDHVSRNYHDAGLRATSPTLVKSQLAAACDVKQADQEPPASEPLIALVRAARYQAATDAQLKAAQQDLRDQLPHLVQACDASSSGRMLGVKLNLSRFKQAVDQGPVSIALCQEFATGLRAGHHGLETQSVTVLRHTLDRYLRQARAQDDDLLRHRFGEVLRELEINWPLFCSHRSDENFLAIRDAYEWLIDHGQGSAVTAWLEQHGSRPNQFISVSRAFMIAALPHTISRSEQINQRQSGAHITGSGAMTAKLNVVLPPSDSRGQVQLLLNGVGHSRVRAVRGRATVWANSSVNVAASQQIVLDDLLLLRQPALIRVTSRTTPYAAALAVRSPLLQRIGGRIVMRVAHNQQSETDRSTEQHIYRRIQAELDQQGALQVAQGNRSINDLFRQPLLRRDLMPHLRLQTFADRLEVTARFSGQNQLGASSVRPPVTTAAAMLVSQTHESTINNASSLIGGETISAEDFRELLFETFALVPPQNDQERSYGQAAAITLTDDSPLSVRFRASTVELTMRLKGFEVNGRSHAGNWTVTTAYRPALTPQGATIERVAPIRVETTSSATGNELAEMLPQFLIASASADGVSLTGEMIRAMQLRAVELKIDDGWFTLALGKDIRAVKAVKDFAPHLTGTLK